MASIDFQYCLVHFNSRNINIVIPIKTPITHNSLNNKVTTKSKAMAKPTTKIKPENPSLNKTITNAKYTSADPVSFCISISKAGVINMLMDMIFVLSRLISTFSVLRYFARANDVANFANSAGCIANPPSLNHDFDPATVLPKNNTPTSINSIAKKKTYENVLKNFASITNITIARTIANPIQSSCFP